MFCGIVNHMGTLESIQRKPKSILLRLCSQFNDLILGESVAVDGVCLTVTAFDHDYFDCELSLETLKVTIAGDYRAGQSVNLERAMRMGDRIGGHLVTGHVDETIIVRSKQQHDEFIELGFSYFSKESRVYLIPKSSVTVNGVSLTINVVDEGEFRVMLIPHTLEHTNLSLLNVNDRVNVEWDCVAKMIARQIDVRRDMFPILK